MILKLQSQREFLTMSATLWFYLKARRTESVSQSPFTVSSATRRCGTFGGDVHSAEKKFARLEAMRRSWVWEAMRFKVICVAVAASAYAYYLPLCASDGGAATKISTTASLPAATARKTTCPAGSAFSVFGFASFLMITMQTVVNVVSGEKIQLRCFFHGNINLRTSHF